MRILASIVVREDEEADSCIADWIGDSLARLVVALVGSILFILFELAVIATFIIGIVHIVINW